MGAGWKDIPQEYKPHWSTWKIEGTTYEGIQRRLGKIGLRDPWLRNEVWKEIMYKKGKFSPFRLAIRGWKSGLAVAVAVVTLEHLLTSKPADNKHH